MKSQTKVFFYRKEAMQNHQQSNNLNIRMEHKKEYVICKYKK